MYSSTQDYGALFRNKKKGEVRLSLEVCFPGTNVTIGSLPRVAEVNQVIFESLSYVQIIGVSRVNTYEYYVDKHGKYIPFSSYAGGGIAAPEFSHLSELFDHRRLELLSRFKNQEEVIAALLDGSYYS